MATPDRVAALSGQLIHVHETLRERLISLHRKAAEGTGRQPADAVGEALLSHCFSFCNAIHTHHMVKTVSSCQRCAPPRPRSSP